MRRFFRSKFFISLVLIILAFILAFVVLPKMYGSQSETMDVIQVIADVNKGTVITEDMLRINTIGKYGTAAGIITDRADIVGKYAAEDISTKEYLFKEMFTDTFEEVEGAADTLIHPGDKLMTFRLDDGSASVGGLIKPGSLVDIMTQVLDDPDEEDGEEEEVELDEWGNPISSGSSYYGYSGTEEELIEIERTLLLSRVVVYKVQNSALEDITALQRRWQANLESGDGDEAAGNSLTPAYVTVIVTPEQALKLARLQYNEGAVHLLLWPEVLDGDEESFANDRMFSELIKEDEKKAEEEAAAAASAAEAGETESEGEPAENDNPSGIIG